MQTRESFFIVCSPGLEPLALQELTEKAQLLFNELLPLQMYLNFEQDINLQTKLQTGGIEVEIDVRFFLMLHQYLRIPTRILLRIESFSCSDLPKLYQKIKKIKWSKYLSQSQNHWHISTAKSRLKIKNKIEESCEKALADHLKEQALKKLQNQMAQDIYLRIYEDQCVISIATSSKEMFKRQYRSYMSHAPLRENLASALFYYVQQKNKAKCIWDPFCGSAVFATEGLSFYRLNPSKMNYSFMKEFFSFNIAPHKLPLNLKEQDIEFLISDMDFSLQECIDNNLNSFVDLFRYSKDRGQGSSDKLNPSDMKDKKNSALPQFIVQDFIFSEIDNNKIMFHSQNPSDKLILSNPPYGERISLDYDLLEMLDKKLKTLKLKNAYFIFSCKQYGQSKYKNKFKQEICFDNGGLDCALYSWRS